MMGLELAKPPRLFLGLLPGLLGQLPGFKQLGMLKNLRGAQGADMFGDMGDLQDLFAEGNDVTWVSQGRDVLWFRVLQEEIGTSPASPTRLPSPRAEAVHPGRSAQGVDRGMAFAVKFVGSRDPRRKGTLCWPRPPGGGGGRRGRACTKSWAGSWSAGPTATWDGG